MVHAFEFDGKYFVYDVESGSAFISDKLVYQLQEKAEGSEEIGQARRKSGVKSRTFLPIPLPSNVQAGR